MRRITSRFVMLIATAAVAPLVIYGGLSISSLRSGTRESVNQGNVALAEQVATRVKLYMDNTARILRSTAQELGETSLAQWQQSLESLQSPRSSESPQHPTPRKRKESE